MSYAPAFAKAAINDVKNSIFQRMQDIVRIGGSETYQNAVQGKGGGVDLKGSAMNNFIGTTILEDLLVLGKVGVYIDMPSSVGPTVYDSIGTTPYLYHYPVEQIRSWVTDMYGNYVTLLLEDCIYTYDKDTGLPNGITNGFRYFRLEDGVVTVTVYNEKAVILETKVLGLNRIPFVCFELSNSLMEDIANYQIALLNMASSDVAYILKANFPFYIEQYDPRSESPYVKGAGAPTYDDETGEEIGAGTETQENRSEKDDVTVGATSGRRYPISVEHPPAFINPSAEPLTASMEKQEQLKREIRQLLNLAIANLRTTNGASAESKSVDDRSLENGLSLIGLILERGEREIAKIWAEYEYSESPAEINYPRSYTLRTEADRREETKALSELMIKLPSPTYQKEVGKKMADALLGNDVKQETMDKILSELEDSPNMTSDPETLGLDLEQGLVGRELASKIRGYPEGEVEKAKKEHIERLKAISIAQAPEGGAARGVPDADVPTSGSAKKEKQQSQNPDIQPNAKKAVRGPSK